MQIFSETRRLTGFRPLSLFEAIGRDVMDFGFGAFLEKFEEYCGRFATRLLVILIGMAVALWCASKVFKLAVEPLVAALSTYWHGFGGLNVQIRIILVVCGVVIGGIFGAFYGASRGHEYNKKIVEHYTQVLADIDEKVKESTDRLNAAFPPIEESMHQDSISNIPPPLGTGSETQP